MLNFVRYPGWIQPQILPGLPLRWYGLMYLAAFVTTYLLFIYQVRKRKLDVSNDSILNFFFWGIIGLLIGARLFATLLFDPTHTYLSRPWLIFWPFDERMRFVGLQGMNYYGGVVGAGTGFWLYCRRKRIDLLDWGDMLVAGIPLGYTFGRLGNFINAELFGRVTTLPWGMIFPDAPGFPAGQQWVQESASAAGLDPATAAVNGMINLPRHPTQIYEGLVEGIILWLVIWLAFRRHKPFNGFVIGVYIIGYGIARFFLDYFRMPINTDSFAITLAHVNNPAYLLVTPLNFTNSQVYSFVMILAGAAYLILLPRIQQRHARQDARVAHERMERARSVKRFKKRHR